MIGVLHGRSRPMHARRRRHPRALRQGLQRWARSRATTSTSNTAGWKATRPLLGACAADSFALQPDVIVAIRPCIPRRCARRRPRTIPIVFVNVADPVGCGFVASLARPGGNLTGFICMNDGIAAKWLELLTEIAPRSRASTHSNSDNDALRPVRACEPRPRLRRSRSR